MKIRGRVCFADSAQRKRGASLYFTYMIRTDRGTIYTGICTDVARRMKEHRSGGALCAKYTRSRPVVALEALWSSETRSAACRLEARIKALSREKKEKLVASPRLLTACFPDLDWEDYVHHPEADLTYYLTGQRPRRWP